MHWLTSLHYRNNKLKLFIHFYRDKTIWRKEVKKLELRIVEGSNTWILKSPRIMTGAIRSTHGKAKGGVNPVIVSRFLSSNPVIVPGSCHQTQWWCPGSCHHEGKNSRARWRDSAKHSRSFEVIVCTQERREFKSESESCWGGLGGGFYYLWVRGENTGGAWSLMLGEGCGQCSSSQSLLSGW